MAKSGRKVFIRPISPTEKSLLVHKAVQSVKLRRGKNQPAVLQQPQLNTRGRKVTNGYGIGGMCGLVSLQNKLVADQKRVLPSGRRRIRIIESNEGRDTINTGRIGEMLGEEAKINIEIQ